MDNATANAMHQDRHDSDGYRRIELITGSLRRRRWTGEEKAAIVRESLQPQVNISELARRWGVNRGLLQTWRRVAIRDADGGAAPFVPLRLEEEPSPFEKGSVIRPSDGLTTAGSSGPPATIEIEGAGLRIRFSGPLDVGALHAVLAHVRRRP